ncbi:MAG: hypothetical protein R2939_20410 [Kofleriaceae bacterium]
MIYLDTFGSNFDTVLRVYPGACGGGGTPVCDDDAGVCTGLQSQLATQLAAGSYCVVVDQYDSDEVGGTVNLRFTRGGRTGTAISASSGSRTGNTCTASDQTYPSCQLDSFTGDVGYYFTSCPETPLTVSAATCASSPSWDSVVHLRAGNAQAPTDLACNDDGLSPCGTTSPIRLSSFTGGSVAGAGLNWLIVDGYHFACGAYTLNYTISP